MKASTLNTTALRLQTPLRPIWTMAYRYGLIRTMAGEFYVYVLFRPWDGSPFYVGKGKAERWLDHERKSTKHTNKHLAFVVEKARRLGLEIPKIKVRDSLAEKDAFEIERALISAMGRRPIGPLVNYTEGGEGTSGWSRGPEWKAKMSRIMTGKPGPTKGRKLSEETRLG